MAQHQRGGQDHADRVGDPLARDVGRRAVHGLEQRRAVAAQRGGREHAERAGEHRRLVGEDVAEHVLGDDHLEVARRGDQLHRARVDEDVLELDVRELLGVDAGDDLAPEPARVEHVGLVDGRHAALGGLEARAGDPLDLRDGVDHRVEGAAVLGAALAVVQAAGELAHDQHVDALDQLALERRGVVERAQRADRAQVGVQAELGAQLEQPLLGPHGAGLVGVPLRAAERAEQDGVGGLAGGERLVGERGAVQVDGRASRRVLVVA